MNPIEALLAQFGISTGGGGPGVFDRASQQAQTMLFPQPGAPSEPPGPTRYGATEMESPRTVMPPPGLGLPKPMPDQPGDMGESRSAPTVAPALANREALRANVPDGGPGLSDTIASVFERLRKGEADLWQRNPYRERTPDEIAAELPMAGQPVPALPAKAAPAPGAAAAPPQGTVVGTMPKPSTDAADLARFTDSTQQPSVARGTVPAAPRPAGTAGTPVGSVPRLAPAVPGAMPTAPTQDGGAQFQQFIRALLTGASAPNNGEGKLKSLMIGAGGSAGRIYQEDQAAAKAASDRAKQQFDQNLAVRKDSREERTANRQDEDQTRKNEESATKNRVAVEKLLRLGQNGTLSVEAKFKLQDQLNRYADKINKNGLMRPEELDAALRKEQARLEEYYGVRQPSGGAAQPAAPTAPPQPGAVIKGYRFKGGDPSDKNNWEKQ